METDLSAEQLYIALLGRSSWALLNCYYAVLRETSYRPTEILLVTEELFSARIRSVREGLIILSKAYNISPQIGEILLKEADFQGACTRIPEEIQERKRRGMVVAVDITSGRKALIAGSLLAVPRESLDHVFYLAITTTEGAAVPYLMIPLQMQQLKDFKVATEPCARGSL
jgi:hypothetical protein